MSIYILAWFVFGLMVGSFLTVLLARLPDKEQVVWGRSRCPRCKTQLAWYDLIPLVSYIFLGGRCRYCNKKISFRYPLIVLLCGVGFALSAFFSSSILLAAWLSILFAISIYIAVRDITSFIIPNTLAALFILWGLVGIFLFWRDTINIHLLSALGYLLFFLILYLLSRGRWIGGGDVKLAAGIGLWLGWPATLVALIVTYFTGGIVGIFLLASGRAGRKTQIPFGPFLLVGSWVAFFFSPELINWYINLLI